MFADPFVATVIKTVATVAAVAFLAWLFPL
jgi:hypothetical protein